MDSETLSRVQQGYTRARDNYVLVFGLILLAIAFNSAVSLQGVGGVMVTIVQAATLLLALRTSGLAGRWLQLSRVLASIAILAVVAAQLTVEWKGEVYYLSMTLLIVGTQAAIIRHEVRARTVTADTVMGALCVYLLLGLLFAMMDAFYAAATPTFFAQAGPHQARDYVYFSFITLATVGYGDLTPGPPVARILAMTEALLGQLYLVTVISLLVGNLGAQRLQRNRDDADS